MSTRRKPVMAILMFLCGAAALQAADIPVGVAVGEQEFYQREFRSQVIEEIASIPHVKVVEPGQGDWFRINLLVYEVDLEELTEPMYMVGYSVLEVPFYLHNIITESLDPEKTTEHVERGIRNLVLYYGSNLIVMRAEDFQIGAKQISATLRKTLARRVKLPDGGGFQEAD